MSSVENARYKKIIYGNTFLLEISCIYPLLAAYMTNVKNVGDINILQSLRSKKRTVHEVLNYCANILISSYVNTYLRCSQTYELS